MSSQVSYYNLILKEVYKSYLENIILDERGYPYLTDFGVAHVQNDPWERYLTCNLASGTKQYLAPEVFTKSHIHGPEVDFWSLGVVIYEVLFGRRPFEKHAPIPFIQYLEKALSLKRRQLKEMKMRELTQTAELTSPILSGFSGVRTSGDSTRQNSFSSISSPGRESRHRALSTAKTSQLTEYSTWEKDSSTLYCSSAGYSQHSRESNKRVIQNQNGMNSGGSTLQDNAISSDNHQQLTDSSNSTPHKRIQLKIKDGFLPQLKQSHASVSSSPVNTSASKTLFKRNLASDEPIDIQAIAFVPNSSDNSLGSSSNDSDLSEPTGRAQPGDHWLVDDGELPEALCVKVPYTNPWLGVLSNECVELLTGLFDVRPGHRYGCRNIDKIRCSPWLEAFKLSDWEELGKKQYRPRFQPGKRFIKDSLTGIDDISKGRLLGTPYNDGEVDESDNYETLEIISPEQEEMFKEFFHVGRIYEENEEPDTRGKFQKTERNDQSHRSNNQRQSNSILVSKKVQDVNAGKQLRERLYI